MPTDEDSELISIIKSAGKRLHEITSCRTYAEYQLMGEASLYISYYPAAKAGGDELARRLGGRHMYLPFSYSIGEIENNLGRLCEALSVEKPDFSAKKAECLAALEDTLKVVGSVPIAIDYTAVPRPLGLARMLSDYGFNVKRVYADSFTGGEKADFTYLREKYPEIEIHATVHAKMRFIEETGEKYLAIGQKAAYFLNTNNFVNIIEGGGMYGFEAIIKTCSLMAEAFIEEKPMRELVQIKGQGCGCCV